MRIPKSKLAANSSDPLDLDCFTGVHQQVRSISEFDIIAKIGEGGYGKVYKALDKRLNQIVAVKQILFSQGTGESEILASLCHSGRRKGGSSRYEARIVDLKGVASDRFYKYLIMEYVEYDLTRIVRGNICQKGFKSIMWQLLQAVKYMHRNGIVHMDLKPPNVLLTSGSQLKICDFGSAQMLDSHHVCRGVPVVGTLWYMAPELLLGVEEYFEAVDMWAVGCIMAELLLGRPLFVGQTKEQQLDEILQVLGSPSKEVWPDFAHLYKGNKAYDFDNLFYTMICDSTPRIEHVAFDLLRKLLTFDPRKRITAEQALRHRWFSANRFGKEGECSIQSCWFNHEIKLRQSSPLDMLKVQLVLQSWKEACSCCTLHTKDESIKLNPKLLCV